ncbi:MAG TPA: MmgE/PrpD family protein [Castellaniella sp.]|uniref:MmgE/PrpD family protein n=1 Tax=Castellaniella sp. TaxID=1955812 RepID=UPI002EFF6D41
MTVNTFAKACTDAPLLTQGLAEFVVSHPSQGWDADVDHAAHRTFINWLGCAIGASGHPTLAAALAAVADLEPSSQASVLGRMERVDIASAAFLNGISSHTFDFDDTHLKTIIHPAGPVASAILALAEKQRSSGRDLLDSLVLGVDVSCRIGNMIYPDHYDRGWHITGTTGMLGAAAGCARLLNLDVAHTVMALGIAASQPVGLREQFGTMTKPMHPGAAARAGLMSALLAAHGFTASPHAIEAPRGYAQTISTKVDWNEATDELGKRFEISFNTFKPFACGIVIHPSIDGCVRLRNAHGLQPDQIAKVDLKVHGLVLELTGKKTPRTGLEGKFSVYHSCAVGLMFGAAGESEYSDAMVKRPDVMALRDRIHAVVDNSIAESAADVLITCTDGRKLHVLVEHAIGSTENPMTDAQLDAKFNGLVEPVLGSTKAASLRDVCWNLSEQPNLVALFRAGCP